VDFRSNRFHSGFGPEGIRYDSNKQLVPDRFDKQITRPPFEARWLNNF